MSVFSTLRDCLAFCTEPVFASLSNVMGQWDNLPSPVPNDIKEYKLYDVETKYGLLQVWAHTHTHTHLILNELLKGPIFWLNAVVNICLLSKM